jgi:hypothetical protein
LVGDAPEGVAELFLVGVGHEFTVPGNPEQPKQQGWMRSSWLRQIPSLTQEVCLC